MEFNELHIYNIIASYIPVDDAESCVFLANPIKKSVKRGDYNRYVLTTHDPNTTYFAENKLCKNGEFTLFSFCELYNVDIRKIDGALFLNHLVKILDELVKPTRDDIYKIFKNSYKYLLI